MSSPSRRWTFAAAAICLAALGLRILGIAYGLPAIYNPDETPILNRALALANDPEPQNFVYPSLYFYLLFVWEGLFFVAGRVTGAFESLAAFQREFFVDPSRHFLAGRAFSALCGTLTVWAVYVWGRRLYDRGVGLASAAALAVSPIAVRDAHYVKLDVPTTMFVVFAHAALARLVVDGQAARRPRTWIVAGALSGLAVSTQYYAIFVAFTMIAAAAVDLHRTRRWTETGRLFLWSVAGAAAGFFAGTPFLPFELERAIADVAHVREVDIDRALAGGGAFSAVLPYLRILLYDAMGWPVWIAAVLGFVLSLVRDWRRGLMLVSFFVPFFVFIANTVPMSRYLNVVLPMVAVAAGYALVQIGRAPGLPPFAAPLLVTLALIPGILASIRWDLFLRQTDTRTLAGEFITSRIPAGRSFLVQPYGPPLRQSRDALIEGLRANVGTEANASPKFRHILALEPYPEPAYRLLYLGHGGRDTDKLYVLPDEFQERTLEPLRRRRIEYVVLKKSNVPNAELRDFEAALAREARRLGEFTPYRADASPGTRTRVPPFLHHTDAVEHPALERPGPIVEVWHVPGRE